MVKGGSVVENLLAYAKVQALFLSHEDPLAKEMATHSSILAWTEEPGELQSM